MTEMVLECLRCKNQEATFMCVTCESFKQLCSQCDSYVHGLPSKKKHKRNVLIGESKFNLSAMKPLDEEAHKHKENKIKDRLYRSEDSQNFSDGRGEVRGNNFKPIVESQYKGNSNMNYISYDHQAFNKGITNPRYINIDEKGINRSNLSYNHCEVSQSVPFVQQHEFNLNLPNYSKEYLNEMKVYFK